ncbi:MAG: hypothetical protein P8I38_14720 [Arenicella sp.]|nr:hypothetical protein [Arenicella sp.]
MFVHTSFAQDELSQDASSSPDLAVQDEAVQAELIWTEFDGADHLLLHSQYQAEQWSQATTIYSGNNPISGPTLAQLNDQSKKADFAVWTEQRGTKTVLMQMRRLDRNKWQPATQFYGGGTNNFAPFVISDLLGNTLVFWSSSDINRLADIVYTVEDDGWSTPRPLHAPNEVPDLTPAAVLNPNGTIEVSWQSYDFSAGSYVTKTANVSLAEDNSNKNNDALKFIDLVNLEKISLPNFLPRQRGRFTVFSALNKIKRAVVRQ